MDEFNFISFTAIDKTKGFRLQSHFHVHFGDKLITSGKQQQQWINCQSRNAINSKEQIIKRSENGAHFPIEVKTLSHFIRIFYIDKFVRKIRYHEIIIINIGIFSPLNWKKYFAKSIGRNERVYFMYFYVNMYFNEWK